ncbi:hypothetical protein J437_LFUL016011 [Ladona fulva]|uniref:Uncharacterized protein n=1 Tax=Ladona fulva TaxID=123851 RepID=A0A8K0KRC4_LADFU|nr:hypothetical protein J437_LFUL016011 [Ladona fulva]
MEISSRQLLPPKKGQKKKAILDRQPYGGYFKVIKSESIGHLEKRMGSQLRNIKKLLSSEERENLQMLRPRITIQFQPTMSRSTSIVPRVPTHGVLFVLLKQKTNLKDFHHPSPLHPDVKEAILPINEDLSRGSLLERCLGGYAQNANESFHSTVWHLAPKHLN